MNRKIPSNNHNTPTTAAKKPVRRGIPRRALSGVGEIVWPGVGVVKRLGVAVSVGVSLGQRKVIDGSGSSVVVGTSVSVAVSLGVGVSLGVSVIVGCGVNVTTGAATVREGVA